jgi:putative peptide zinc metalloprotease protein
MARTTRHSAVATDQPVAPQRAATADAVVRPPTPGDNTPAGQPDQAPTSADVPEQPTLAPNIVMSGEMEESGFAEPQWMVQRDGQFIHLTELLYHVAEQVDGTRNLDEIAAAMSEKINRDVSADNVRQLIGSKLIPLGVVVGADGKVVGADAAGEGAVRSPLKINMKTKVLPRGLITPLTKVLKVLFFPPILIAMLLVCLAAQGWLFFVHGIAGSIHEAVYKPWLTLVILGIIVVGTAWHEFGHAAALEYGGGEVRGMGAGFYLVYPAFYTDVTDNYRLGRWARVRTDLGGFYFNLIFCLGLIGLYALTRQPFLLLGVLLIDVDIIHQCLPFVRLDGYWTLADITGIPDFFSYMGPFLRSVLPLKKKEGDEKLPEFKRWVKVLFAIYIIVTIPILAFLLFEMLKNVPRILATAWDSFGKQWSALADAGGSGHYGGVALAVLQILLLALPVAGLGFALFSLGRTAMRLLWNWAKPTPARRVVGSLATAAFAALLAFLWLPSIPFSGSRNTVAAQNWTPIAATERGTVSDALPPAVPAPFRSPVTEPTTATKAPSGTQPAGTTTITATGTANVSATPGATTTPTASGTPGATPAGTPTESAPTAVPVTVVPTPVPASATAQAPAPTQPAAPAAPAVVPAATTSAPSASASTALATLPVGSAPATPASQGTPGRTLASTGQAGVPTSTPAGTATGGASTPASGVATLGATNTTGTLTPTPTKVP